MSTDTSKGPKKPLDADDVALLELIASSVPKDQDPLELIAEIEAHPFFMTELPENAADNPYIQALQALAYDGEPWEVAEGFKDQGNECARAGKWKDAKHIYMKGVAALRERLGEKADEDVEEGPKSGNTTQELSPEAKLLLDRPIGKPDFVLPPMAPLLDMTPEETAEKERIIEISLLLNLSLANYKLSNFRSAGSDASHILSNLDPTNIKAFFRLAQAHYALGRPSSSSTIAEEHLAKSLAALNEGLKAHPENLDLTGLQTDVRTEITRREKVKQEKERQRVEKVAKRETLQTAIQNRGWKEIQSLSKSKGPSGGDGIQSDLEIHQVRLESSFDLTSDVLLPVMVYYPTASTTDFLHSVSEHSTVADIVNTVLNPLPPWAEPAHQSAEQMSMIGRFSDLFNLKVFADVSLADGKSVTAGQAGVIRVGRNVSLVDMLKKAPIRDGLVGLYIVPFDKEKEWVDEMRKQRAARMS